MFDTYYLMDELDRELAMLEEKRVLEKMQNDFPALLNHETVEH